MSLESMWKVLICVLVIYVHSSKCFDGIDTSVDINSTTAQCLAQNWTFAVVKASSSDGSLVSYFVETVENLWSAGFLHVDIYVWIY